MVDLTAILHADKSLKDCDDALIAQSKKELPRPYLGASSIGEQCSRKLWYRFRWLRETFDSLTLKRFRDGHITENTVVEQLRLKYAVTDTQWGFNDIDGHFSGHIDGIIEGLVESKVPHVLEIKATGDKKFAELKKAKAELGEKMALRKWNPTYYAQIVLYMFYKKLTRSFHVVATAGGRDWMSIRTESDNTYAKMLIDRAKRIIYANDAPEGISRDPSFYECKMCSMFNVCHNKELPPRQCRVCVHSSPVADGKWSCKLYGEIDYEKQLVGCPSHAYLPSFIFPNITTRNKPESL